MDQYALETALSLLTKAITWAGSGLVTAIGTWILVQIRQNKAIKKGLQAALRSQLIDMYNEWVPKKWAPLYVKDNYENVYTQYHSLGKNGVMDRYHEEFMSLPDFKPQRSSNKQAPKHN